MKLNINMVLYKLKNRKYVYLNKAVTEKVENEAMIYSITSLLAIMSFFDYLTKKIL